MKKTILLTAAAALMLTGCSKLGKLTSDNFKVTPTPLVETGSEVPAQITVTFPEKFMKKKAQITATPVLRYAAGETSAQSVTYQGEKIEGNGTDVNYKLGGTYNMKANFRYTPEMLRSDLYMTFEAKLKKKVKQMPDVKIGYGVLATEDLLSRCLDGANAAVAPDNFQRVIEQKQEANIKFLIAQSNLRTSELQSVSIKDLVAVLKEINDDAEGRALDAIEVSAYASPDGRYSFNEKLAERRQNVSADYLKQELKKIKMDADINTRYTAEDWDGFQELVSASNLQDKNIILSVLSMYKDPEEREQQIRNMSAIYTDIKDGIMPELRRARLIVNYEIIGRSDEEILNQYKQDASKLSLEELVYGATMLVETPAEQKDWNQTIQRLYPNDYRALNNQAQVAYAQGDYAAAADYLAQAKKVNSRAAEVNTNLALMELRKGNLAQAESYLAQGFGANTYNEVLGCYNLAKGNYAQAVQNLEGANTNTAALAQLLAKDYAAARQTLSKIKNADATTAYLQAILAARTGDAAGVVNNLRQAIDKDASLKARAKDDLEFAQFASTIASLVK
ncbi:MAG: hypothetical protein J5671_01755 [Bacteroidaceae bacterium]|nr:hypothetical protein [Bacteroidaceae bacterium]